MSWECVSYWIEHHPGLASWLQAAGSILAILAAIRIASSQRREQIRNDSQRREIQRQTINVLAKRAARGVKLLPDSELSLIGSANIISGLRLSFESVQLIELPDPKLVEPISTIRDSLRALEAGFSEASKRGSLMRYAVTDECCLWVALIVSAAKMITPIVEERDEPVRLA